MGGFEPQGGGGNWRWNGREWVDIRRQRVFPWRWVGLVVAVALVAVIGVMVLSALRSGGAAGNASRLPGSTPAVSSKPSGTPSATATPAGAPAPASAAGIDSVAVSKTGGSCQPGASCDLEVSVKFPLTTAPQDFAWTVQSIDACTGATTDLGQDHVTAQAGWNNVVSDRSVNLPGSKGGLKVVVVTSSPARASSPPLQIPGGTC